MLPTNTGRAGTRLAMNCSLWRMGDRLHKGPFYYSVCFSICLRRLEEKFRIIKQTQSQSPPLAAVLDSSYMARYLLLSPTGCSHPFCVSALPRRCPEPLFTASLRIGHLLRAVHTAAFPFGVLRTSEGKAAPTSCAQELQCGRHFHRYSPRLLLLIRS